MFFFPYERQEQSDSPIHEPPNFAVPAFESRSDFVLDHLPQDFLGWSFKGKSAFPENAETICQGAGQGRVNGCKKQGGSALFLIPFQGLNDAAAGSLLQPCRGFIQEKEGRLQNQGSGDHGQFPDSG
jgi:hypothetical protein